MDSSSEARMDSFELRSPCIPNLGFCLVAGALAGLLFAAEVNSLQPLVWIVGIENASSLLIMMLIGSWSDTTAVRSLCCVAAGLILGVLSTMLLPRIGPKLRRSSRSWLLLFWVSASFLWVFSADFPAFGIGRRLAAVAIVLAWAFAAYFIWRAMLQWLRQGRVVRTTLATAATTFTFWIYFFVQTVLR